MKQIFFLLLITVLASCAPNLASDSLFPRSLDPKGVKFLKKQPIGRELLVEIDAEETSVLTTQLYYPPCQQVKSNVDSLPHYIDKCLEIAAPTYATSCWYWDTFDGRVKDEWLSLPIILKRTNHVEKKKFKAAVSLVFIRPGGSPIRCLVEVDDNSEGDYPDVDYPH